MREPLTVLSLRFFCFEAPAVVIILHLFWSLTLRVNISECVQRESEFSGQSGIFLLYYKQPKLYYVLH